MQVNHKLCELLSFVYLYIFYVPQALESAASCLQFHRRSSEGVESQAMAESDITAEWRRKCWMHVVVVCVCMCVWIESAPE